MTTTSYIVLNVWLAAAIVAPSKTPGTSIWSHPKLLCIAVATITAVVGWAQ